MRDEDLIPCALPPASGFARVAIGFAFVVFVGVIGVAVVWENLDPAPSVRVIGREAQRADAQNLIEPRVLDGAWMRRFEKELSQRSRLRHSVAPYWAAALLEGVGEADPTLLVGRDGWLFLRRRLTHLASPPWFTGNECNEASALIAALGRRLASVGTRLVVVPVPRKCEVFAHRLPSRIPTVGSGLHDAFVASLRKNGVDVVDIMPALHARGDAAWWKHDSHWSDAGALAAATRTADTLASMIPRGAQTAEARVIGQQASPSDQLRTAGVIRADGAGPQFMIESGDDVRIVNTATNSITKITRPHDVQDVSIVGTSYSAFADGLFPAIVSAQLGLPVSVDAWPALGPVEPMRRAVARFKKSRFPKVLLWEIPEHEPFAVDPSMDPIGSVFALIPDRLSAGISAAPFLIGEPILKRHDLKSAVSWGFRHDSLVVPSDGALSIRIRGRVTNGPVNVTLSTDTTRVVAEWPVGDEGIVLPMVGSNIVHHARLVLRPLRGSATVDIESVEGVAVADLTKAAPLAVELSAGANPNAIAQVTFSKTWSKDAWVWFRCDLKKKHASLWIVGLDGERETDWRLNLRAEAYDREVVLPATPELTGYRVYASAGRIRPTVTAFVIQGATAR